MKTSDNSASRPVWIYAAAVILGGCLWGTMGYFRRGLGELGLASQSIVFIRCSFSAVLFAVTILIRDPKAILIRPKDIWCFIGSGIVSLLFFSVCYFRAMEYMDLSAAAVLLYTAPCFVMLFSAPLFKEKITGRKVIAIVLTLAGCALISGLFSSQVNITVTGILYGLGAGIGYALYSIFGKLAMARGYSSNTVNFWACLLAALGSAVLWGIHEPLTIVTSGWNSFGFAAATAVITTYLPYLLYTFGLSGIEAGKASVMASVEPVVAAIVGLLVFSEPLSFPIIAGMALVIGAIILLNIKGK